MPTSQLDSSTSHLTSNSSSTNLRPIPIAPSRSHSATALERIVLRQSHAVQHRPPQMSNHGPPHPPAKDLPFRYSRSICFPQIFLLRRASQASLSLLPTKLTASPKQKLTQTTERGFRLMTRLQHSPISPVPTDFPLVCSMLQSQ